MKFTEALLLSALTFVSAEKLQNSGEEPCKFKDIGYECCSHCNSIYEDQDGLWGVENNQWCGILEKCYKEEPSNPVNDSGKLQYFGVNESSGEFGEGELPGIYNKHYIYPDINAIEVMREQGMNAFRVCNRWERLQQELFGEFNEFDITEYKKVIDSVTSNGSVAIIDPHNYARYKNELIGSENVPVEAFVDFWTRLAELFKDNEKVWFGLVNEPHDMDTEDWFKIARAAVDGIRSTGAKNNILIPGNGWTGAWSWGKEAWYGEANADVALKYFSSEDENILFEVHQYFDEDYSGSHDQCVQRPCQNHFKEFVEWLKTNNLKGFVGEIGSYLTDECKECIQEAVEYLQENNEYIVGTLWWAAGPWWGHNGMSIEPNNEKAFPGQMAWLKPYLPGPSELTEVPTFINKKVYCEGCVVTGTGGDGSLWGWENEKSCEIDKEACGYNSGTPIDNGNDTPVEKTYCKGCVVTGTGGDGSLWGWEDEKSCEIDVKSCKLNEEPSEEPVEGSGKLQYFGVNESSGEFGEGELPGIYNKHYIYPDINAIEVMREQGMNAFRVCNRWERLQQELFGEFNEFDITEYKKVIDSVTSNGSVAIIDPHNYARYKNELIGSENVPVEAFVDFWTRLAELFKDNEKVWFGLVNEPHDMDTEDWFKIARAAVDGIRSTGAKNNILIPGNGWTGAWSWGKEAWYGEANADVALKYFSSEDENILFEVHQYFDEDYSGSHDQCVQRPCQNHFKEFVEWLKTNNLKGFVGEIGSYLTDECKECIQEAVEYLQENNEYIVGTLWWAAGPWWGHNGMSIEPNNEKAFPGQMAWLKPYLPGPSELTEVPTFINKKVYCEGCVVTGTGGDGSLWGWENEKSCEIDKEACGYNSGTPIDNGNDTPVEKTYCKGCVVTGTGGDGSLWGWEDEKSCEIDVKSCKLNEEPSEEPVEGSGKLQYFGVNESSGEFGEGELPGIYNKHYIYPDINAIEVMREQGMNAFRVCNRWERLQQELFGEFNEFDITEYKKVIDSVTSNGSVAIIDPHNYARYKNELIGSENVPVEAFVDFWTRLAELFKDNEKVWFGLVNEPHDMDTEDWFKIARAAVDGIRSTGAKNNILIPGNGWTGAWSWGKEAWYGEANADVALKYFSSEDENILFEVHQYFDEDYSGSHDQCVQRPCQNHFKEFVEWLKTNNLKGFVGEIGSYLTDECKECVQEAIEYLQENNEYIVGTLWWAAGPWWGHNGMSIEPNNEKAFPGQMAWLKPYLPGPSELTEVPTFINKKVYCEGCVVTGTGGDGSLWGWENEKSCEIDKEACGYNSGTPIDNGNDTPVETNYCKGCVVTGTGGDGSLWGWEDEKSCQIDEKMCNNDVPTPEDGCWSEHLGYKCCSHCMSITEDEDGAWGAENGEWCGIPSQCSAQIEQCWSYKYGYPCCENCNSILEDDLGSWGVLNNEWCGIPSTC